MEALKANKIIWNKNDAALFSVFVFVLSDMYLVLTFISRDAE